MNLKTIAMNVALWNFYKSTPQGQELVSLFNPETDNITKKAEDIFKFAQRINSPINEAASLDLLQDLFLEDSYIHALPDELTRESFEWLISGACDETDPKFFDNKYYRNMASFLHLDSIALYLYHDFFKPILYPQRFDLFQKYCNAVGIELPEIPRTNSYKEYMLFYYDICESIKGFQIEYQLTDAEVCALIYGCAELLVNDGSKASELPRPINVWLTGASKEDFNILENGESNNHIWACNERTRRGDIVVIYCKSPYSYIHSIWRASSEGIFNPFDYYHCRTIVSDGVKIPKITYDDLKSHQYLSTIPIVRKNLQGINGVELSSKDYTELLNLIESKGGDISILPKLFENSTEVYHDLKLEQDVEEKLLIPLLDKLGYKHDDWKRQLYQKAGRGMKAIPDFVFFPKGEKGYQNAPFLIEAKLDMSSVIELKKAFGQALSYSRMMQCKIMGICDKERLILYRQTSSGVWDQSKPIFENHWDVINNDAEVFTSLRKIIAPEIIKDLK